VAAAHSLWSAALDLGLTAQDSLILVTQAPQRWDELLDARLPVLISSRVGSWDEICAGLWEAGCPPALPARLVESNGEVQKVSWHGPSLQASPSSENWVLALGWTHPNEGWRTKLPLWGQRYVVTRAADHGGALVERLQELGAEAYSVPTIAFTDPDDFKPWIRAVNQMADFDWILFTSPNGVDAFVRRLCQSGHDLRVLGGSKLACIGPSTAKALARHGLKTDLLPKEFIAEGLVAALTNELGQDLKGLRFLLPRAQVARSVLPDALAAAGASVLVAPVYKTVAPDLAQLPSGDVALLFTSSSTVTNWVQATPERPGQGCYCIGPITAATARDHGLDVLGVAQTYTIDGLLDLLIQEAKGGKGSSR
jgi:uroporphyrinogen III methyltransferase/synthase